MSEHVFVLGAGVSMNLGAPLMADFLEKADLIYRQRRVEHFGEHFERVARARSALQQVHSKTALDIHNLESVFGAFDMARLLGSLPGLEEEDVETLPDSMRVVIAKTLEETIEFDTSAEGGRPMVYGAHRQFAETLGDLCRREPGSVSVVSFNYDIITDFAMECVEIGPDYALADSPEFRLGPPKSFEHTVPLLKLHGSINWAKCSCPDCTSAVACPVRFFINPEYPVERGKWPHGGKVYIGTGIPKAPITCHNQTVSNRLLIVPPTWNKGTTEDALIPVWRRAAEELRTAQNVYILGYSLPETDIFFRYMFALGLVGPQVLNRFWVFNPDQDTVESRFRSLLGPGAEPAFRYEKMHFDTAVEYLRKKLLT